MPVITRNQRINNVASMEKPQSLNPVVNQQVTGKVRPDLNNLLPWFASVVKEGLKDIEIANREKLHVRHLIKFHTHNSVSSKVARERELRTIHFDNIRRATELMFFVDQYLPEVRNLSPSMERFTKAVYAKIQDLYQQIRAADVKPETDDERRAVVAMIYVLQDVEKNIIPLLPADVLLKRRRNFVDYTGMDTIEPESEYDGITDIWFDLTLAEDPDYEPTEDEEDDDLDRYVVYDEEDEFEGEEPEEDEHDYSEDEDYVPEDDEDEIDVYEENEIFEILVQSSKKKCDIKEPRKVLKSPNHILFEYDE